MFHKLFHRLWGKREAKHPNSFNKVNITLIPKLDKDRRNRKKIVSSFHL